jgi:MAP/microtubule affinity-regulating kinase
MLSGQQPATLDSHPIPIASPSTYHRESPYPVSARRSRLPTFHAGAEWNLEAPSDADLYFEQQSPPTLSRSGAASRCSPISSTTTQDTPSISASPAAMFLAAFSPPMKPAPHPDDEGQVVAGYTLGGIVGYGGSSIIRRAFSTSGGIVAVKIVKHSEIQNKANSAQTLKKLQHEAEVWGSLSHEHILPLFATVHSSYADFFVTLFCPAGSLYDILQRDGTPALMQDDAGMMFRQVVRGLRYLHEVAMYVHRDIKLENVLVDEMGVCRIGDFGMSKKIGEIDEDDLESDVEEQNEHDSFSLPGNNGFPHRSATFSGSIHRQSSRQTSHVAMRHSGPRHRNSTSTAHLVSQACQPGSLPYASPEILVPQTHGPLRPSPSQDMWALGVLLHTLLTGQFPFWDSFEPRLQMKILQGESLSKCRLSDAHT